MTQKRDDLDPKQLSFIRKMASASRPLTEPHPAATNPYAALLILREHQKLTTWTLFGLVDSKGDFIHYQLDDIAALASIKSAGTIQGSAGIAVVGDRLITFVMPFLKGEEVVARLTEIMTKEKNDMLAHLREVRQKRNAERKKMN